MEKKRLTSRLFSIGVLALLLSSVLITTNIVADDPKPSIVLFGNTKDDWYISCVTFGFSTPPEVRVDHYEYKHNGEADWQVFTNQVTICENGYHSITWRWMANDGRYYTVPNPTINFKVDNAPPTIELTKKEFQFQTSVLFTAEVDDGAGSGINYVEFYKDGVMVENVSTAPYEYLWDGETGYHDQIYAIVYDNLGFSAQSETLESRSFSGSFLFQIFEWIISLFPWLSF